MDRLWLRMTEIYGHRWSSSYGTTPNDTWIASLSQISADELKTGLDAMLKECLQWPPTLTEFISFCRKLKIDPSHKLFALPAPCNINREEGKKRSAELMKMMKGEET